MAPQLPYPAGGRFREDDVDSLVSALGLPLWPQPRPKPVLWLAVDDGSGPRLVSVQQANAARPLLNRAIERGYKLGLPSGGAAEQALAGAIWRQDSAAVARASSRYSPPMQLIGKLYRANGGWQADWVFVDNGRELNKWTSKDANAMRAMAAGADGAADALVKRYAKAGAAVGQAGTYRVVVTGINSADDYLRLAAGLREVPVVRNVTPACLGWPAGAEPGDDHRPGRLQPHAGRQRRAGAERSAAGPARSDRRHYRYSGGRPGQQRVPPAMTLTPEAEIAQFLRRLKYILFAGLIGWVVWLLAPILTPFVLALALAWLGDPLVDRIEATGRSRMTGVVLVFAAMVLVIVALLLVLVPMIERQITTLIAVAPQAQAWLMEKGIPWFEQKTGLEVMQWLDPDRLIEWVRSHWQQAGGFATTFMGYVSRSGFAMVTWVVNILLLPILAFYFLRDWDKLVERVASVIPRNHIGTISALARESNEVLGAFIRGQFLVMLALGVIYAGGLSLVGLKLGLLIGLIAGLISFIPYLGATTGVLMAVIAALVQAQGFDLKLLILVGVVFTVGQLLESYVLTPRIVGDKIGLHPVAVIFAVMAGGQLFGFLGMLLALPVAAVTNVLLRYAHQRYRQSELYVGEKPAIVLDGVVDAPHIIVPNEKAPT